MKKSRKDTVSKCFDVVIIGGGAAGMSAALWCDDLGLSAVLLEKEKHLGGQLHWVFNPIKNHLGAEAKNGRELQKIFLKQIKKRKFELITSAEVSAIDLKNKKVFLLDGRTFSGKALVIATGVRRRKLNVEGEDDFAGKGILESGKKDLNKVSGKTVLIVGGGDAAMENALILAEKARKVYVAHRRKEFRARAEFLKKAEENPKIEFLTETTVQKINGKTKVESVELKKKQSGSIQTLAVDAILIRIGVLPNTEIFKGKLKTDKEGYILIDDSCETNVKGIFCTGDSANPTAPTVSTAVGNGATAVKNIQKRIRI